MGFTDANFYNEAHLINEQTGLGQHEGADQGLVHKNGEWVQAGRGEGAATWSEAGMSPPSVEAMA